MTTRRWVCAYAGVLLPFCLLTFALGSEGGSGAGASSQGALRVVAG